MFGALNRFIARLDAGSEEHGSATSNAFGFQVLRNTNAEVPLEPWFDFIIGINGRTIDNPDSNLFATEVRNCAGSTVSLGVFSAKGQKIRELYIPIPADQSTLGLSLQWTSLSACEDVWHILDVAPNSPADVAGLLPYSDYIIGSPDGLVRGESGLGELVEDYLNRPLRLYVYNHEYNVTRPLTITPTRTWGGEGALGCVLGFGALHRIPPPLEEPPHGPGETLFSSEPHTSASLDEKRPISASSSSLPIRPGSGFGNMPAAGTGTGTPSALGSELFIPANMVSSKSPPPPPSAGAGAGPPAAGAGKRTKARAHHHAAVSPSGGGLDDYFKEGEQKSREEDYAPKSAKGGVPPPPKAGGPPKGGPPKAQAEDAVEGGE